MCYPTVVSIVIFKLAIWTQWNYGRSYYHWIWYNCLRFCCTFTANLFCLTRTQARTYNRHTRATTHIFSHIPLTMKPTFTLHFITRVIHLHHERQLHIYPYICGSRRLPSLYMTCHQYLAQHLLLCANTWHLFNTCPFAATRIRR